MFEKIPPAGRRNWKAELELEQLRSVLELDQEDGRKEESKDKETD